MVPLVWAFCLLVAASGWFYLFYSRAAIRMADVECQRDNLRRVRLRRLGGVTMILLSVAFFAGTISVDSEQSPLAFMTIWLTVIGLMGLIVLLGFLDLRLTLRLRKANRRERL